jgi:hypothetical protein
VSGSGRGVGLEGSTDQDDECACGELAPLAGFVLLDDHPFEVQVAFEGFHLGAQQHLEGGLAGDAVAQVAGHRARRPARLDAHGRQSRRWHQARDRSPPDRSWVRARPSPPGRRTHFAWLHNRRRLLIRSDRLDDIHKGFLALACCLICWQQLDRSHRQTA